MINAIIVTIIYTIFLFLVSPVIDHVFTPLDEEKTDARIMGEVISQIIAVTLMWYIASEYVITLLNRYFKVKNDAVLDKAREVIAAVITVGLQTHLIKKLEYLTHRHPFRFLNIHED